MGVTDKEVAKILGTTGWTVGFWRKRFNRGRLEALYDNWLTKRPRYHLHFTPTHSSWINQVERWFAQLSQKQIKRGNHHSVKQLQEAIETFVKDHNASCKPFRWVKSADQILASITRFARSAV